MSNDSGAPPEASPRPLTHEELSGPDLHKRLGLVYPFESIAPAEVEAIRVGPALRESANEPLTDGELREADKARDAAKNTPSGMTREQEQWYRDEERRSFASRGWGWA